MRLFYNVNSASLKRTKTNKQTKTPPRRTDSVLICFSLPVEFLNIYSQFFLPKTFEPMSFSYLTIMFSDYFAEISCLLSTRKPHQHCKSSFTDVYIFLNTPTHIGNICLWFRYCSILKIVFQIFSLGN